MSKICDICGEFETGRIINGKAICTKCYIDGQYNLPENQDKLVSPVPAQRKKRKRRKSE